LPAGSAGETPARQPSDFTQGELPALRFGFPHLLSSFSIFAESNHFFLCLQSDWGWGAYSLCSWKIERKIELNSISQPVLGNDSETLIGAYV